MACGLGASLVAGNQHIADRQRPQPGCLVGGDLLSVAGVDLFLSSR
jgi:hypothetical protein